MKKQFVTYEIALKLKELGFDEECFGEYNDSKQLLIYYPNECFNGYCEIKDYLGATAEYQDILAPLWQQVIDWLDENYVFLVVVKYDKIYGYQWDIRGKKNKPIYRCAVTYQRLYDARERAILTAIELCKQ